MAERTKKDAADETIKAQTDRWDRETRVPSIGADGERKSEFKTQAMRWPVKPIYTPADLDAIGFDYLRDAGFPGEFPYTRGNAPNGYRSDLWTMSQVTGFGTGEEWAKRGRFMLDQGLDGLIIEYDLPTTNGYDSDHPLASGEVGRAGTAIDSLVDMEAALDLPFEKLKRLTSVCNAPQPVNLGMVISALQNKGVDPRSFTLQMPNAILIEYTCVGRYIYPPEHGLRLATDSIEYVIRNHPNWLPISVISAQLYAARANPVQELAFGFSIAMQYIDDLLARGLSIDEVAPYFTFVTGIDMDFFEAVGKLRAYRKVWAKLMRDRYGAQKEESLRLKLTASPGTMSMTLQQPLNNIARIGMQLLACAIGGGAQAMTSPLHDEAHALPSEEAIRVGAAVQNIVAHETGAADTIDPLAGSYYVETLTKQIEDAVFAEIEKVDAVGGGLAAIEKGYFQRALADEQCTRNQELEDGTRKLVGVNHLQLEEEDCNIELFRVEDEVEKRQIESVQRVRKERDAGRAARALDDVRAAAANGQNVVPAVIEAVQAHATHGEVCDAMRDVFGEYHPNSLTSGI